MFNTIYDILSLGLRRFTLMSHGENTLLRVTPTLTHYSDIVSGISSGSIYGIYIYILTFFLAFYLASILTFYLAWVISGIYSDILSGVWLKSGSALRLRPSSAH